MRLYIIRHADPYYEEDTITDAGHLEAQALSKRLLTEGLDRIYCSPLGRAKDTARYTAELVGIKPEIEEWTEEFHHWLEVEPWGNIHICDIPGECVRCLKQGDSHDKWHTRTLYNNSEIREKIEVIKERSDEFLKRHGYEREGERFRCVKPSREKIAIFCHAALGMTWLAYLLGIPEPLMWSGFWPAPSSVTTVLLEERSAEWAVPRCIGFGDTSHLFAEGLPISNMGIKGNFY